MSELSREELRAHLSAVEAQVRAALRIVAAESKSVQQAHGALRADLSSALIRLQTEMNDGQNRLDSKLDRVLTEVNALGRQRRMISTILFALVLLFGVTLGLFAGGGWYFLQQQGETAAVSIPQQSAAPAQTQSDKAAGTAAPGENATESSAAGDASANGSRSDSAAPQPDQEAEATPTGEPSVRILTAE